MSDTKRNHFVADGHKRLHDASKDQIEKIEKEVILKYQSELNSAGFFKEIYLRYKIHKEIQREIDKIVPKGGLYLHK
jgi:ribosomal protein S3AE